MNPPWLRNSTQHLLTFIGQKKQNMLTHFLTSMNFDPRVRLVFMISFVDMLNANEFTFCRSYPSATYRRIVELQ